MAMDVWSAWRMGPSQCCRCALRQSVAHFPCAFSTPSVPCRNLYLQETSQIKWIISGQLTAEMREPRKVMWVSQQLQLICGYRVYAWAQGKACMEGGLSLCAMCMVGWSLVKRPFFLPGTDLQGGKSCLAWRPRRCCKSFTAWQEVPSSTEQLWGRVCFSHPSTLSPFPYSQEKDSTASPFYAKQLPPPGPLLFFLGKEQQSRGPPLFCTHLTHGQESSYPLSCAVTSLVLRAGALSPSQPFCPSLSAHEDKLDHLKGIIHLNN